MDFVRSTSIEMSLWPVEHFCPQFFSRSATGQMFIFIEVTFYKIHILVELQSRLLQEFFKNSAAVNLKNAYSKNWKIPNKNETGGVPQDSFSFILSKSSPLWKSSRFQTRIPLTKVAILPTNSMNWMVECKVLEASRWTTNSARM